MRLSRRNVAFAGALALGTSGLLSRSAAIAQSGEEAAVNQAIEALRKAMVDADKARLEELVADQLSYGHSSGVIESKAQFVSVVAGKKTILQVDRAAGARHHGRRQQRDRAPHLHGRNRSRREAGQRPRRRLAGLAEAGWALEAAGTAV